MGSGDVRDGARKKEEVTTNNKQTNERTHTNKERRKAKRLEHGRDHNKVASGCHRTNKCPTSDVEATTFALSEIHGASRSLPVTDSHSRRKCVSDGE